MGWVTGSRNSNFLKNPRRCVPCQRAPKPEFKAKGIIHCVTQSRVEPMIRDCGLSYVAAIMSTTKVRPVRGNNPKPPGRQGRGSVHHIAFRAEDDSEQAEMARKPTTQHNLHPAGQRDRCYFRSIYFREPGGVLFEIAADIPGFAIDEPVELLGSSLKLPGFLEPRRSEIEAALPAIEAFA